MDRLVLSKSQQKQIRTNTRKKGWHFKVCDYYTFSLKQNIVEIHTFDVLFLFGFIVAIILKIALLERHEKDRHLINIIFAAMTWMIGFIAIVIIKEWNGLLHSGGLQIFTIIGFSVGINPIESALRILFFLLGGISCLHLPMIATYLHPQPVAISLGCLVKSFILFASCSTLFFFIMKKNKYEFGLEP